MESYTVEEFCRMHKMCVSMFYKLRREGNGPKIMKINSKTLVSDKSNQEWVQRMEENSERS